MTEVSDPELLKAARTASVAERGISPIAGRLGSGFGGKAVVFAALVAGCGVFLVATWGRSAPAEGKAPIQPARQVVAFEPARQPAPTLASPGPDAPRLAASDGPKVPAIDPGAGAGASADTTERRRAELAAIRGAPILAFSRGGDGAGATNVAAGAAADPGTELDQLRQGSRIGVARAARLPDRNFLIVAGSAIPCLLQTAMDSTTAGYVSCLIPRDVYSDNGAVVLMEKGTRVLGEYRSGMRQGQRRLFVLWTRAVTPGGVAVSLASPAADALGRAGFDGQLDSHFWERFGGALLLSVVDDGAYAIAGRDDHSVMARLPSDAAGIALQNSVNIPPSLRKAQGAEVSIFVAQDLDFSRVYALRAR